MGINLVIMGPPGAGKGTQATKLAAELGISHLSTGDLLRQEIADASPIGIKIKNYMDSGVLVPDKMMTELAAVHVLTAARDGGFILDGYPRTIEQAQDVQTLFAKNGVALSGVVNLQLPDGEIVQRLVNRRTCSKCQRSYHVQANPSRVAGVCDVDGAPLITRKDDVETVIRHRIRVYWEQTAPVVEFYKARALLHDVDARLPIAQIAGSLSRDLGINVRRNVGVGALA